MLQWSIRLQMMMYLCQRGGGTASHPAAHILKPFCRGSALAAHKLLTYLCGAESQMSRSDAQITEMESELLHFVTPPITSCCRGNGMSQFNNFRHKKRELFSVFLPTFKKNRLFLSGTLVSQRNMSLNLMKNNHGQVLYWFY